MSIHKQLPTSIRNIRAKVRPLLRPVFWGTAGVLLLVALFVSEYGAHPERFSSLVNQEESESNNPEAASGLTQEERAKAADMDSVSVLLKELKQAGAAPDQKTQAPPSKGLFEEINGRAKESAPAAKQGAGAQNSASGKQDPANLLAGTALEGSPLSASALQALGILPGDKPAGVRSESPAAGQRYNPTSRIDSLLPASPDAAALSPLQAAMDRYYGRVRSSAEPASPSGQSGGFQQSSGAAPSRATPAQAPPSANPDGRSYLEAATGMPVPESPRQISPPTLNIPGLTGPAPTDAANPSGNAYTYLTGSGPAADAPIGNPLQQQGSTAAQNSVGQIPFGDPNQGLGATPLGNPLGGSNPATGATTPSPGMQEIYQRLGITAPSAIYQNVTPPLGVSAPGSAYQNVTPPLGVSAPGSAYQNLSPGAGVTAPGAPYQNLSPGAGVTAPGAPYQGVSPGIGVTAPGAPYQGVSPGIGANVPANPYNYGNPSAQPAQPAQQPNFSVPRTIGGGQINTFSNP